MHEVQTMPKAWGAVSPHNDVEVTEETSSNSTTDSRTSKSPIRVNLRLLNGGLHSLRVVDIE